MPMISCANRFTIDYIAYFFVKFYSFLILLLVFLMSNGITFCYIIINIAYFLY